MRLTGGGGIDGDGAGGPVHARRGKLEMRLAPCGNSSSVSTMSKKVMPRVGFAIRIDLWGGGCCRHRRFEGGGNGGREKESGRFARFGEK